MTIDQLVNSNVTVIWSTTLVGTTELTTLPERQSLYGWMATYRILLHTILVGSLIVIVALTWRLRSGPTAQYLVAAAVLAVLGRLGPRRHVPYRVLRCVRGAGQMLSWRRRSLRVSAELSASPAPMVPADAEVAVGVEPVWGRHLAHPEGFESPTF